MKAAAAAAPAPATPIIHWAELERIAKLWKTGKRADFPEDEFRRYHTAYMVTNGYFEMPRYERPKVTPLGNLRDLLERAGCSGGSE